MVRYVFPIIVSILAPWEFGEEQALYQFLMVSRGCCTACMEAHIHTFPQVFGRILLRVFHIEEIMIHIAFTLFVGSCGRERLRCD